MYKAFGILNYSYQPDYGYRLVVNVDREIVRYYRALMPKSITSNPQMYPPHISVVRKEIPVNLDTWGNFQGQQIPFYYDGIVHFGQVYIWLNIFSQDLEQIRLDLGLPVSSPYTLPPDGFHKCFHMSLGNFKGISNGRSAH